MDDLTLYTAIVTSIDDPDQQGKIQIRILPELEGTRDDLLPWAVPFVTDVSKSTLINNLPSVNSTIRVLVGSKFKRFYYLGNRYFPKLFDFSKVKEKLDKISVESEYKNLKFILYEDGSLLFHNINDGSSGFIHNNGNYGFFDKDGKVEIKCPNFKIVDSNGESIFEVTDEVTE